MAIVNLNPSEVQVQGATLLERRLAAVDINAGTPVRIGDNREYRIASSNQQAPGAEVVGLATHSVNAGSYLIAASEGPLLLGPTAAAFMPRGQGLVLYFSGSRIAWETDLSTGQYTTTLGICQDGGVLNIVINIGGVQRA